MSRETDKLLIRLCALRDEAMRKAYSERIPECGVWGEVAQEMDSILSDYFHGDDPLLDLRPSVDAVNESNHYKPENWK